jgi:oligopeptide transport system ATP-binding protein
MRTAETSATAAPEALVEIQNLKKHFPVTKGLLFQTTVGQVKAVDDVSFVIRRREALGLVGESGCGKSTVARCLLKLLRPTAGGIYFDGADVAGLNKPATLAFRRRVQAIFQDPYSSLNPRMKVGEIVGEPLYVHGRSASAAALEREVHELLELCGLPRRLADHYPHEMSGGQRQRVGIARALALRPEFIVCDEPVSALDVSIQAQIINLLEDLQGEFGLTYLFIGHDLSVVRHLCQRVAVMYLGRLVEIATTDELFDHPMHPYTQALLAAVPEPDPVAEHARVHQILPGEVPSPLNPPSGCVFHPRCRLAEPACRERVPALVETRQGHWVACPVVAG